MSGVVGETERLARAALTRVIEPGDEVGGRWLREFGAVELMRRLTSDGTEAVGRATDRPVGRAPGHADGRAADPTVARGGEEAARGTTRGQGNGQGRGAGGAEGETGGGAEGVGVIEGVVGGVALTGVSEHRLGGFRARAAAAEPARDLEAVAAVGGRFICPDDQEWPRQLDDLGDARPIGLWVRGRPQLRIWALRSVAVVGARACTPYGAHMAASLATGLAERGWVVVSGAAFGVDGAAHRGVLAAGGATVAVLACGVDVVYPRGHAELIGRIAEQGLVIGELPPGSHPTPSRFILRNRVIAALTRGTVVVEAEYRSGSLVTARSANKLGRFTMGVPGPVTSGLSAGVHELLRGEGVLVTDAAEVVELVGSIGDLAPARRGPVLPRDLLDPVAAQVLDALPAHGRADARDVARSAGTTPDDALGKLYELHSLGFVERQRDGWQLVPGASRHANEWRGGA